MTPPRRYRWLAVAVPALLVAGCGNWQSALHAEGGNARISLGLIWGFTLVCVAVWVLVMLALGWALARRRTVAEATNAPLNQDARHERIFTRVVGAAVAATVLILVALTLSSYFAGKSIAALTGTEKLDVSITGNQWWWEVRYENGDP